MSVNFTKVDPSDIKPGHPLFNLFESMKNEVEGRTIHPIHDTILKYATLLYKSCYIKDIGLHSLKLSLVKKYAKLVFNALKGEYIPVSKDIDIKDKKAMAPIMEDWIDVYMIHYNNCISTSKRINQFVSVGDPAFYIVVSFIASFIAAMDLVTDIFDEDDNIIDDRLKVIGISAKPEKRLASVIIGSYRDSITTFQESLSKQDVVSAIRNMDTYDLARNVLTGYFLIPVRFRMVSKDIGLTANKVWPDAMANVIDYLNCNMRTGRRVYGFKSSFTIEEKLSYIASYVCKDVLLLNAGDGMFDELASPYTKTIRNDVELVVNISPQGVENKTAIFLGQYLRVSYIKDIIEPTKGMILYDNRDPYRETWKDYIDNAIIVEPGSDTRAEDIARVYKKYEEFIRALNFLKKCLSVAAMSTLAADIDKSSGEALNITFTNINAKMLQEISNFFTKKSLETQSISKESKIKLRKGLIPEDESTKDPISKLMKFVKIIKPILRVDTIFKTISSINVYDFYNRYLANKGSLVLDNAGTDYLIRALFVEANYILTEIGIAENVTEFSYYSDFLDLSRKVFDRKIKNKKDYIVADFSPKAMKSKEKYAIKDDIDYSYDYINADIDVDYMLERLNDGYKVKALLYGKPGTGKSEFAKHIAQRLNKDVTYVNVTDYKKRYVGDGEEQLTKMFKEAASKDNVMIIDECDSAIMERDGSRDYNVDIVNNLLNLIDNHDINIFMTTNFMENIDKAMLRRINLKLEFKPLRDEHKFDLFKEIATKIDKNLVPKLDKYRDDVNRLTLTPGIFKSTLRRLLFVRDVTVDKVYNELEKEAEMVIGKSKSIGFR